MNKCIDRKDLQEKVNKLTPDYLDTLELALSENIIKHYEDLKNMIHQARTRYID